ncbi:hypothetical protein MTO96_021393 [Rhipicephalus appendiculatus]
MAAARHTGVRSRQHTTRTPRKTPAAHGSKATRRAHARCPLRSEQAGAAAERNSSGGWRYRRASGDRPERARAWKRSAPVAYLPSQGAAAT